jgi:hypothetical protein
VHWLEITDAAWTSRASNQEDLHADEQDNQTNDDDFRDAQKTGVGPRMLCVVHGGMPV